MISDGQGFFILPGNFAVRRDSLLITHIGYENKIFAPKHEVDTVIIELKEQVYELEEFSIRQYFESGVYKRCKSKVSWYFKKGQVLAFPVPSGKKNILLQDIEGAIEFKADSILIRVSVSGDTVTNQKQSKIFYLRRKEDIRDMDIYAYAESGVFWISVELLEVFSAKDKTVLVYGCNDFTMSNPIYIKGDIIRNESTYYSNSYYPHPFFPSFKVKYSY